MKNIFVTLFAFAASFSLHASGDSLKIDYRFMGRLFVDGGLYTQKPAALHHGAGITETRLGINARIRPDWYAQVEVSFAKNKVALNDAYVEYARKDNFFRVGHMVGLFSIDESNSTSSYLFHTGANVAETFYPGRRIGVAYTRSRRGYYVSAGAFCGDGLHFDENTIQGYNFTGRAIWRPFHTERNLLHLGGGVLFKVPDKEASTGRRPLEFGSKGTTYLASASTIGLAFDDVDSQTQANIECLLLNGRWLVQSEYLTMYVARPGAQPAYRAHGGYVQGGFLVKGSSFGYDPVDALPTVPVHRNSVLLVCRYNCTNLNDVSADLFGGKQHDVSVGVNYYFNRYICSKLNYSHLWLDSYSGLGKCRIGLIQARVQVKF